MNCKGNIVKLLNKDTFAKNIYINRRAKMKFIFNKRVLLPKRKKNKNYLITMKIHFAHGSCIVRCQ